LINSWADLTGAAEGTCDGASVPGTPLHHLRARGLCSCQRAGAKRIDSTVPSPLKGGDTCCGISASCRGRFQDTETLPTVKNEFYKECR